MKKNRRRDELVPDLTPLMDIMFLLLIFFIVTSVFRNDQNILALNLPKTEGASEGKGDKKELVLELSKDKFVVNKKEVSLDDFSNVIKSYKDPKIAVDFRVDKDVVYDRIVKVLSVLQQNNLTNLSLVTSKL
ncbi:MAG: ExbD/TolR family protein [Bacteriovoracaceae bacterium]